MIDEKPNKKLNKETKIEEQSIKTRDTISKIICVILIVLAGLFLIVDIYHYIH